MSFNLEKKEPFTYILPQQGNMKVPVTLYLSPRIEVEDEALKQLADVAAIDQDSYVFATPDIHTGYGVPIGSIWATPKYISPSAVGYDINCGMRLLATPFCLGDINPAALAGEIAGLIPLGEGKRNLSLAVKELGLVIDSGLAKIESLLPARGLLENSSDFELLERDLERVEDGGSLGASIDELPARALERGLPQLGTLGGGNHFIEIQVIEAIDDQKSASALGIHQAQIPIMIHSGSRGLGHETAGYYLKIARQHMAQNNLTPPSSQLLFFKGSSPQGQSYLKAMNGAANYAFANRQIMCQLVRKAVKKSFGPQAAAGIETVYDVCHNIVKEEIHEGKKYFVHRKGATRAYDGERMSGTPFRELGQPVLIPGSMGTSSYVLLGYPSSKKSFYSVNHGAGRRLSRSKAAGKKGRPGLISDKAFKDSMQGIHLITKDQRRIKEEAPGAYKDIDEVINIVVAAGLALPVARMRPLAVLKG